ncbi:MAG TPA: histidine kinase [Runella sp.]|nr:histidine kinase [Runella sp.]HAO49945.1 histidine kinase [Runella sp.]
MKFSLLSFFFLLFWGVVQSQNISNIDSIPSKGLVLSNGWKWHVGDNHEWANPEFDDSDWKIIDPTQDVNAIPELSRKGYGWFRTTIEFSPMVAQKLTTLQISQSVASEVYINGILARKIGDIDAKRGITQAANIFHNNSIGLPYSVSYPFVQIAVRVAYERNSFYNRVGFNKNHCFRATLIETENAPKSQAYQRQQSDYGWFQVGVFFILTFLHLSFFSLYRTQRANLYFSGTTLALGIAFFCIPLSFEFVETLSLYFIVEFIQTLSFPIAYLFLIRAIYEIYHQKTGILFWLIVVFGAVIMLSLFTPYSLGSIWAELGTELLMTAEVIRVTVVALRKHLPGARLIMIGMGISLVMFMLFYFDLLLGYYGFAPLFPQGFGGIFTYQIAVLCVPLSISLYLAISFSQTNKVLIEKLQENNTLTQKTLQQEQERQQLLEVQNETLERQVRERTSQLEQSLEELRAAQNQLIQKEKMASLGELTAGIAHEIQNPLNFVNNFAELSVELIDELKEEAHIEGVGAEILADISQNLGKINHHGKRASSIVKGMLEHSRMGTGERQPTDINALCDEYLRLSFHGMRAKDKAFNADFQVQLDPTLSKINVVPQDLGRVLLNLFNNAFYAVNQRNTVGTLHATSLPNPTVSVQTKRLANAVEIKVSDNGNGIPNDILPKIFQPFFTTKPTGEGTGLGLSLSYDIITKGHDGTLEVESAEGKGTTFTIKLPLDKSS